MENYSFIDNIVLTYVGIVSDNIILLHVTEDLDRPQTWPMTGASGTTGRPDLPEKEISVGETRGNKPQGVNVTTLAVSVVASMLFLITVVLVIVVVRITRKTR